MIGRRTPDRVTRTTSRRRCARSTRSPRPGPGISGIGQPLLVGMVIMAVTGALVAYWGTQLAWRLRVAARRRRQHRERSAAHPRRLLEAPERGRILRIPSSAQRTAMAMEESIPDGTVAIIDGVRRIYYDGYWLLRAAGGHARRQEAADPGAHPAPVQPCRARHQHPRQTSRRCAPRLRDRGGPRAQARQGRDVRGRAVQPRHRHLHPLVELQELGIEIATDNR